jgi:hypothetical protein
MMAARACSPVSQARNNPDPFLLAPLRRASSSSFRDDRPEIMKPKSIFLALLVLVMGGPIHGQYLHPKISGKQTQIRKVVILPAKVEIVRQSMKGPEGMTAESDLLSTRVSQLTTEALGAKQITVLTEATPGTSEADAQRKYTVADIQARYDALLPKIEKKQKDVKKGRFSLGDEVLNLNLDKNADAIVFIRGQGQKLTKGKSAFTLLVGGLPAYLQLLIGVVDARTGEVLVFANPISRGDATSANDKSLLKAIENSLKKLPPGGP